MSGYVRLCEMCGLRVSGVARLFLRNGIWGVVCVYNTLRDNYWMGLI